MTNALVVARRELSQLFHSPLAYVFLILFVIVVQLPFVLVVFVQGQADLRMFFDTLPWCLVLFAALVTMRSWAEERQENTYEMLLTFPMREHQLVLGKFLSSFAFLLVGLACTAALPAMLLSLGKPDVGAMASGYLGAVLLAAMWCAGGVFLSGLTRSQLLAAIVTVALALFSLFLGTETVSGLLDARFGGLGSFLETMVGGWSHYAAFAKGVLELADLAYFVAWTAAFLWLNALYIGLRRTPGSAGILAVGTPLALGCAMLVGRLTAGTSWARADLTQDRIYTLSPGTVRILSRAKVPVRVTLYVSPRDEMPKQFQSLEREIVDRLREIEVATGGKLVARVERLAGTSAAVAIEDELTADEEDPEKALAKAGREETTVEKRALAKGVRPFDVPTYGTTETSIKRVFSTLAIRYREKDEEYLQPILPETLPQLEYLVANTTARMVRAKPPKVALVCGQQPMDPQLRQMYQQMKREPPDPYGAVEQVLRREKFDVERVALSAHEPMPEDYDALVVVGPSELDERQQWEIGRALAEGRPTILAVQRFTWEYRATDRGVTAQRQETNPGLDAILEAQGLGVSREILMDENQVQLSVPTGDVRDLFGGTPVKLPTHVLVNEGTMSRESVITDRLRSVLYLWGTPVTTDDARLAANGLTAQTLFTSGARSWTRDPDQRPFSFNPPADGFGPRVLAVRVRGTFKDAFAGKERPKWPFKMEDLMRDGRPRPAPPDPPATELRPAPGQLLLLGCARMWSQGFVDAVGNPSLLLHALDAMTLGEDLALVRSKQPTDRRFDTPTRGQAVFWSALPLGIVPLLIVGAGLAVGAMRLRRREAWEAEHRR